MQAVTLPVRCDVCQLMGGRQNPLLYCDGKGCDIAVHPGCYGVSSSVLDSSTQKWYCKRCEPHSTIRSTKVKCFACPQTTMYPIVVDKKRLPATGLQCYLCHESNKGREQSVMGHTQKCSEPGCERRMHPTCAQDHRLLEVLVKDGKFSRSRPQGEGLKLWCKEHKAATPEPSPVKGGVDDADAAEKKKGVVLQDGTVVTVGDQIKAYWKGGRILYEGTVAGINDDETISINYHDGDYEDNVAKERIRPSLMVRQAKSHAARTMAEQAKAPPSKKEKAEKEKEKEKAEAAAAAEAAASATPSAAKSESASRASTSERPRGRERDRDRDRSRKRKAASGGSPPGSSKKAVVGDRNKPRSPTSGTSAGGGGASSASATLSSTSAAAAVLPLAETSTPKRTLSSASAALGASTAGGAGPKVRTGVSKDPLQTPLADRIEAAVSKYVDDDGKKVASFLFRAHDNAEVGVFERLRAAREAQRALTAELDAHNIQHDKLARMADDLFAAPPEVPQFCATTVGATAEDRVHSLRHSLAYVLGSAAATEMLGSAKVDAQLKSMSEAIDRAVGL